ncbi:hypothetical protein [Mycolicibacterium sp. PDY-3]|uniref:hypothetical protein n=1 Tax=Mycolicibacterium sp. PDY-3 TaxID=3376069 RepID=UPI0037A9C3C2
MTVFSSKYTIELWTRAGTLLADLGTKPRNRVLVQSRNEPDDLSFDMDLVEFERYCDRAGVDPKELLIVNSVEVRIKRHRKYLSGGQLVYRNVSITANENTLTCRVFGFLQLFAKRYTGESTAGLVSDVYSTSDGTADLSRKDLAWALINQSQNLANGSFGITIGPNQAGNTTTYQKNYSRTNIKDALQGLTTVEAGAIDIEFTHDKKFNTYDYMGSDRPDIVFEYPGNITSIDVPEDGTDMTNEAIGIGRGAADGTQTIAVEADLASQAQYRLRQDTINSNGTDNSDGGITDDAKAEIQSASLPLRVPSLVVDGNFAPFVTDYGIGDRVRVKVSGYKLVDNINGMYRIERRTIRIDENDNEEVILEVSG